MKSIRAFIKKETVFTAVAALALISMALVPPSAEYIGYINFEVLSLLFCLMAVVLGLQKSRALDGLAYALISRTRSTKALGTILVLMCFFLSMLITNDVALITLVPLTIGLLAWEGEKRLIFIIVMETVAANLGSLVTPVGNPQNLFLFSKYNMNSSAFFGITLPLGAVSLGLVLIIMLFSKGRQLAELSENKPIAPDKAQTIKYLLLFLLCHTAVFKLVHYLICLGVVFIAVLATDREVLKRVDYMLLLTFVCFFVFVGNISKLESVKDLIGSLMAGQEMLASVLISQVISNVPAAVMLSAFAHDTRALLMGVNIGGLGTLVASLASLISYRLYSAHPGAQKGRYLLVFSLINFALLAALVLISSIMI